jgi:hypothetical protein
MLHTYAVFEDPAAILPVDEKEDGPDNVQQEALLYDDDELDLLDDVERNAINLKKLFASANDLPEAEQPKGVKTPLLSYQKQGLHFLLERERDPFDPEEDAPKGIVQSLGIWEAIQEESGAVYYNKVLGMYLLVYGGYR